MKLFYDCEFLEDGRTIELISIGMAAEDGREYYAVNANMPIYKINGHGWLMDNVWPHLPWYGLGDYSEHVLAAHKIDICGAEVVDLAALTTHPDRATWDAALSSALDVLGITPTQEQAGWILCSYYG